MLDSNASPLILSIFFAAFLGSWHCAIMCGPLCISLSQQGSLWPYHLGRLFGYVGAGALAGFLGQRLLWHQNPLIQKVGLLFMVFTFAWLAVDLYRQKTPQIAKSLWKKILKLQTKSKILLGTLSVFLPCGWLFYFLLAAAATQSPWSGSLVLFLLWLSGLPALAGSTWLMRQRLRTAQPAQQRIATVIITLAGFYALFAHYF
jgi:uncharacterized protein